ncbi:MAG: NIL domain-containing protein [bacterium]
MPKKTVHLSFPEELIQEPIIYNLGHEFKVVTSIFRASVGGKEGWIDLGLEGDENEIRKSIAFLKSTGIRVQDKDEAGI